MTRITITTKIGTGNTKTYVIKKNSTVVLKTSNPSTMKAEIETAKAYYRNLGRPVSIVFETGMVAMGAGCCDITKIERYDSKGNLI